MAKMTLKHKAFIRKELIPFILREAGRGFAMDLWREIYDPKLKVRIEIDGIDRLVPHCGTVACIGGSIETLRPKIFQKFLSEYNERFDSAGRVIGLSSYRANRLFLGIWPDPYTSDYHRAKTPKAKALVAARLLEEVAKTSGKVLG